MQTIPAKTIVTRTRSRWWFGTDYNMNLYRGCTHGCIYCDSRSSCYHNPDFDHIAVKENALTIVRDDLRRKVQRGVVATGAMSDPYNPLERKLGLTRHALELLSAYGFGVAVDTKSDPGEPGRRCALGDRGTDAGTGEVLHHHSGPGSGSPSGARGTISGAAVCRHGTAGKGGSVHRAAAYAGAAWPHRQPGESLPAAPADCGGRRTVLLLLARPDHAGGTAGVFLSGRWTGSSPACGRSMRSGTAPGTAVLCRGRPKLYAWVREECSRLGLLSEMEAIIAVSRQGYDFGGLPGSGKPVFIGRRSERASFRAGTHGRRLLL